MTHDAAWTNKLYYGDNLDIMRKHIADESVDLICLGAQFDIGLWAASFTEAKSSTQRKVGSRDV